MDELMVTFNESLPFEKTFYKANILGSIVYAKGHAACGLISPEELSTVQTGLESWLVSWAV
jgi:argininosuccinate lyase